MTRLRASDEEPLRPEGVPEGSVVTVFRVPPEMAGMRLDQFVRVHLKRTSRTRAQFIIEASAYGSRGQRLRSNHRVLAEERVMLWRAPWDEAEVPTEMPVLYEDDDLFAIDKPAGIPVHPTARYHKNTVIVQLQNARPNERPSLAHRIDRETSGVLFVTKNPATDSAIKKLFAKRDAVEKRYLTITWGVPAERKFTVDLPLEIDPTSSTKVKMRVAAPGAGLFARTHFEVLETRQRAGKPYALVACDLDTGRQHQIRVHLAARGTPIVGDKLYAFDETYFTRDRDGEATDEDRERLEIARHALHAHRVAMPHPTTKQPLEVIAPLPPDLRAFWDALAPMG